jgi:hypothetical protein
LTNVIEIDLTGFNSIVMMKKEALKRKMSLVIVAQTNHPIHEYIHLSKLSFHLVNRQTV